MPAGLFSRLFLNSRYCTSYFLLSNKKCQSNKNQTNLVLDKIKFKTQSKSLVLSTYGRGTQNI